MSISMTHTLQSKNMSTWADVYNTLIDTCDKNIKNKILLFSKNALNWSIVAVKTFIMLQKILFQINSVLLNFLFTARSWKIKYITVSRIIFEASELFSALIIIRNVSWAENQYIRIISKGSCDTENWSNDAEKSALITATFYSILQKKAVFHNITVFTVFFIKINSDLLSRTDFFQNWSQYIEQSRLWF